MPKELAKIEADAAALDARLRAQAKLVGELPEPETPEADITEEQEAARNPLIDPSMSWTEQTLALKARKTYGDGEDEDAGEE